MKGAISKRQTKYLDTASYGRIKYTTQYPRLKYNGKAIDWRGTLALNGFVPSSDSMTATVCLFISVFYKTKYENINHELRSKVSLRIMSPSVFGGYNCYS